MALVACKECGRKISTHAAACPGCGAPQPSTAATGVPAPKLGEKHPIAAVVLLALFIGAGLALLSGGGKDGNGESAPVNATAAATPVPTSQAASITVPQSDAEKKLLADMICVDESECYGYKHFDKDILREYPDIAKVAFHSLPEMRGDPESIVTSRQDFHRGLYFAKQIKLADGETLFDFLTKCSKPISPPSVAQLSPWAAGGVETNMQFFPVLRLAGTNEEFEMQILFDRRGDRIEARSALFSTSILRYPDFMARHGLKCWRQAAS